MFGSLQFLIFKCGLGFIIFIINDLFLLTHSVDTASVTQCYVDYLTESLSAGQNKITSTCFYATGTITWQITYTDFIFCQNCFSFS